MELKDFRNEQQGYISRMPDLLKKTYSETPKACVITYGCQQNVSDSERMKGMLSEMGYVMTDEPEGADFVLYNTCAVRGHAEDRVYGNVGAMKHYKRRHSGMIIAICGCMAQQEAVKERIRKSYPYVDIVFGTHSQYRLPEFLYKRLSGSPRIFEIPEGEEIVENVPVHRDGDFKAWLPIMYGCNNFCSYCIVPYVRGRERSRHPYEILKEARELVAKGYKDITLLGQNVNSYGAGCDFNLNFAGLLRKINEIDGDFRIRFMTSHPKDCTIELLDAMKDCEKVSRHLHLPFQSGSDRILKMMNRRYTREKYLSLVNEARKRMPDISITSDIIVGFPGETYEDFCETLSLVKEVGFSSLFTFIYSPRNNTPAASMDDPVSREEKGVWFDELLRVQESIGRKINENCVGKIYRVLCDDFGRNEEKMAGHTNGTAVIEFDGDENDIGKFINVKVEKISNVLEGTRID
ncbi:MAG: tRNA (N6-isopentenyl adenosine(37)-C2)-methylthiotransferase MiaB [Acutalibacteraceae bacterium]|nr:tRNA (N6-isopentenyl adenosine(37)-C2)-methylthiotransferase MiaB [Acutalibacteraceae bacterium]